MKAPKRKVQHWDITKLKRHPKQAEFFNDLSDTELQSLARDIEDNGQLTPVEILPDGTIIAGHQRVRAVKSLGWEKVRVWVRQDLADAGEEAVEKRLLEASAAY